VTGAADARSLVRGVLAGAGAMIAAVVVAVAVVAIGAGAGGPGWADHAALTGVLLTAVWCVAAAGAAAVGAWQAAEGGAPRASAARLAGTLGPVLLIVLVSVAALGADRPSAAVIVIEAVVEVAAAVAGATALARRLEPGW
jgi:hypothetical protein